MESLFEYIPTEISAIIMFYLGDIEYVIMANICHTWRIIIIKSFRSSIISKKTFVTHVAKMGYLNIIKWARENNCQCNAVNLRIRIMLRFIFYKIIFLRDPDIYFFHTNIIILV